MKRFLVDYFDSFDAWREGDPQDGWGKFDDTPERLFDSIEEARACRDHLNAELGQGHKDCGDHWGIIDGELGREVECPRVSGGAVTEVPE